MNRDCNGDYFCGLQLYRCFGDGTVVRMKRLESYCPHCKRTIKNVNEVMVPKLRTVTKTFLQVKVRLGWLDLQVSSSINSKLYTEDSFKDRGVK